MKKIPVLTVLFVAVVFSVPAWSGNIHHEKYYQEKWCREREGRTEVLLPDHTRCDCLTKTHAIEFDFGNKWAEAIGQSLYYALQTGKHAGIVLIIDPDVSLKYQSLLEVK